MSGARDIDVAVVGGGSFGTALAAILAQHQRRVWLWVRRSELAEEINQRHTNSAYAVDYRLPDSLKATSDLAVTKRARLILVAVPSKAMREVARQLGDQIEGDQYLVHATKGLEVESFKRMSEILREETCALKVGVLSGPNLAKEILDGQPTGALVASRFDEVVSATQELFGGAWFRVYGGRDVIGTELGGAFKNIIALASGFADGMGFGSNAKSLLLTRGLSEMARLGVRMGANVLTFGGLAGMGDLIATCTSPLSRNHRLGIRIGKGESLAQALQSITQVAEGVPTTQAVHLYSSQCGMDLPIVRAVYGVLFEGQSPQQALKQLMAHPVGEEMAALPSRLPGPGPRIEPT